MERAFSYKYGSDRQKIMSSPENGTDGVTAIAGQDRGPSTVIGGGNESGSERVGQAMW